MLGGKETVNKPEYNDAAERASGSLERVVSLLREACQIYREASQQGHSTHWDATMQHGRGCPECIRARELRAKGDAIMEQVNTQADR